MPNTINLAKKITKRQPLRLREKFCDSPDILVSISSASLPLQSGNTNLRSGNQMGSIAQHNVVGWDEKKALQSRSTDCVLAGIRNCRPFVHLEQRKLIRGLRSKTNNKQIENHYLSRQAFLISLLYSCFFRFSISCFY